MTIKRILALLCIELLLVQGPAFTQPPPNPRALVASTQNDSVSLTPAWDASVQALVVLPDLPQRLNQDIGCLTPAALPDGEGFRSADAVAKALVGAANAGDVTRLISIIGPSAKEMLVTSDAIGDEQVRRKFDDAAQTRMRIVANSHDPRARTLLIGKENWPLPVPIVHVNAKWYFDLEQGKQEILARRIGSNELDAIEVCRGYVEAQNDYAGQDRTGSGKVHYAQKIIGTPGRHDGLY